MTLLEANDGNLPFIDRPPNRVELEKLRLILSTFQDGTGGQKSQKRRSTLPDWRNYERAFAIAFDGDAVESKFFVDVVLPLDQSNGYYGIDCKMKKALLDVNRGKGIYIEVSNAAGAFWEPLDDREGETTISAQVAGPLILEVIDQIKREGSQKYPKGMIDLSKCYYVVMLYDFDEDDYTYQLFQLPIRLPQPDDLVWHWRGNTLVGEIDSYKLYEWYSTSGGQLKCYPPVANAVWISELYHLEPLKDGTRIGLEHKAKAYFPTLWEQVE